MVVTYESVEFQKYRSKFKTSKKLPIVFEEFVKHTPDLIEKSQKKCQQVVTSRTWKQRISTDMPKKFFR